MPTEENKALGQRTWEIVGQRSPDLLEEVYAADLVWHEPDQDLQGLERARQFYSTYLSAFPDLNASVEDAIAEGDKAVTRYTIAAKQGAPSGTGIALPGGV